MSRHQLKPQPTAQERLAAKRKLAEARQVQKAVRQQEKLSTLGFDYGLIAEEHRPLVRDAAIEIRARLKRTVTDMIEIGQELNAVRGLLPSKIFYEWAQIEFGMSRGSVFEFVQIAKRFSEFRSKFERILPSIERRLAAPSVPDDAVTAVITAAADRSEALPFKDAMAIVKPFLPVKPPRPKQLPGPVAEPAHEVIEAEYTVIQPPTGDTVTLRHELLLKMIDGAAHKVFMPFLTRDEHDELFIALARALKGYA